VKKLSYEYDYDVPAYFAISKYCNIDCSYCYLPDDHKNQKADVDEQALSAVHAFIDKAVNERFALSSCYLHGAEPTTLSPEAMREAIESLLTVTLNNRISVQTNGVALNKSYLTRLGEMQDKVAFGYSVDLPPAAHNKNRSKTYSKVVENIGIAKDMGYSTRLLVCINQDTMEDLEAVKAEIEMYHKNFPAMTIAFKHIKGDQVLSEEQKVQWADFLADNGWHDYDHSIWGTICNSQGNNCWWFEFCSDGGVTACNKSYSDAGKFADWHEEPMTQIMDKRRTLYQNHSVPKMCFGCRYWRMCRGGCPVDRSPDWENITDDAGLSVSRPTVTTLDCAIKQRIWARMEAGGFDPMKVSSVTPQFIRQKAYNNWKSHGERFGFLENDDD
jgi:radical SAM protein with 4Fe4S-binding SPASM domain